MSNIVTVSGMFGEGHTYFADSPVVIDISGLQWPGNSPFNIVILEVLRTKDESVITQLPLLFPNSNAPFYSAEKGYITSASIWDVRDDTDVTHHLLIAHGYSLYGNFPTPALMNYMRSLEEKSIEDMLEEDRSKSCIIVEIDSTQARRDTLLQLCEAAYGSEGQTVVGNFKAETGGQSEISFDISSALRAIWSDYDFSSEASLAGQTANTDSTKQGSRMMREYALRIFTEYLDGTDGQYTKTQYTDAHGNRLIPGGQCLIGGMTEWERSLIVDKADADVSSLEHTGVRNGDASTKPISSPERIGKNSITSWVDVKKGYTESIFYPASAIPEDDDIPYRQQGWTGHAPIVLRDNTGYVDFLFINRRGAVETCSGQTLEAMNIDVETKQYSRVERPTFRPTRSLMAVGSDGRRSWQMSSGLVTREWAEWWTMEFLGGKRKQWWMRVGPDGKPSSTEMSTFVPVIVEPSKKSVTIYDRTKQEMPHVDFTVTLALEG